MIFIVVKVPVRPDRADQWLSIVDDFTRATRAEEGNLMFEWSRSVDDPNTFFIVEAFRDAAAGAAHVATDHFKAGTAAMSEAVAATPQIIHADIEATGWSEMGEVTPRPGGTP